MYLEHVTESVKVTQLQNTSLHFIIISNYYNSFFYGFIVAKM